MIQAKPNTQKKNIQFFWIILNNRSNPSSSSVNNIIHYEQNKSQSHNNSQTQTTSLSLFNLQQKNQPFESYKQKAITILQQIQQDYATFRFYDISAIKQVNQGQQLQNDWMPEEICREIINQYKKYILIKRRMVCAFFLKNQKQIDQILLKGLQIENLIKLQQKSSVKESIVKDKIFEQFIQSKGVKIIFHYDDKESSSEQSLHQQTIQKNIKQSQQTKIKKDQIKCPYEMLKFSRKSSLILGNNIFSNIQKSSEEIIQDLIKYMQLDFVWVGLLSRLGSDIQDLKIQMMEEENFTADNFGYYKLFLFELNRTFKQLKQNINLNELLKSVSAQLNNPKITQKINQHTEQLVKQKFNSRIILSHITSGQYFHLLISRNYFNLLYIECNTLGRYERFRQEIANNFPEIAAILSLENFLLIDDYWYRNYILKCMPYVKFIIDRGDHKVPYSEVIRDSYKHIVPPFRPSLDQYFITICNILKKRAGCVKQAVGSILVKDKRIIATGYNNTPIDTKNCCHGGCFVCNNSGETRTQVLSCLCIHAEYGCILEAGIQITPGSTLYSTKLPCLWCAKLIVQGRIKKIVYSKSKYEPLEYRNLEMIYKMLNEAKIQVVEFDYSRVFFAK